MDHDDFDYFVFYGLVFQLELFLPYHHELTKENNKNLEKKIQKNVRIRPVKK